MLRTRDMDDEALKQRDIVGAKRSANGGGNVAFSVPERKGDGGHKP